MKSIRPVLRYNVHGAAGSSPVASIVGVGHHVDFLHRIQRGRHVPRSGSLIAVTNLLGDVRTVEGELIESAGIPRIVLSRGIDAAAHDVRVVVVPSSAPGTSCVLAARRGADEVVDLAAADRNVLQSALVEDGSTGSIRRLNHRRCGGDLNLLVDGADLQRKVLSEIFPRQQQNFVLNRSFETGGARRDGVGAGHDIGNVINAGVAGLRSVCRSGFDVNGLHLGFRHNCP